MTVKKKDKNVAQRVLMKSGQIVSVFMFQTVNAYAVY